MTTQNTTNETAKQVNRVQEFLFGTQMEEKLMTKQQIAQSLETVFGKDHPVLAKFEVLSEDVIMNLQEMFLNTGVSIDTEFYMALIAGLEAAGIALSDTQAVTAYLVNNFEFVAFLQKEFTTPIFQPKEELVGDLHDGLLAAIESTGSFTDTFMWVALQAYGGKSAEHTVFAAKVASVFDNDKAAFGEYVRTLLNVDKKKLRVRDTALFTADTVRLAGDLTEKAVIATAKLVNKVAFQMPSNGLDKVAKRPEELSHVNVVKQGVNHPFPKESVADISARLVDEKKMAAVKKKKAGVISKLRKQATK